LKFDDDTGVVGVEYQASPYAPTQVKALNVFSRKGSHGKNSKAKQEASHLLHQPLQQGSAVDNASSNSRKGFGFLRPLSRKRSKAIETPRNTSNNAEMFMRDYQVQQAQSIPFVEIHDVVEESSGLTPPRFYHTRSDIHSRVRSKSSNMKVRSESPLPRSSSRLNDNYQIAASSHGYTPEAQMLRSPSRSASRNKEQPPRSSSRSHKPSTPSRSSPMNTNVQRGRSLPRSRSRSGNKMVRQRLSVSRGGSKDPQWTRKTTSIERKRSSSAPRFHHVQGIRRENKIHVNHEQIIVTTSDDFNGRQDHRIGRSRTGSKNQFDNEQMRMTSNGNYNTRQVGSRGKSQSRNRSSGSERIHEDGMAGYNLGHTQSVQSRKSQYSDVHMVRSISNKGNSGTLGILTLNASSSEDSDYFVK
jgi:hypothetical protein